MTNLTNILLDSVLTRVRLPFGVNEGVVLYSINNAEKRSRTNVRINKGCYMTFGKVEEGKIVAASEFSYWHISEKDRAAKDFIHQYTQLSGIMEAVIPKDKLAAAKSKLNGVFKSKADIFLAIAAVKRGEIKESELDLKAVVGLQQTLFDTAADILVEYTGVDGQQASLAVVTGFSGKFDDLPQEDTGFIFSTESAKKPLIDGKYILWRAKKDVKETAASDLVGAELDIDMETLELGGGDELEDL